MRTPSQFYQRLKGKYIDSVGKIGSKLSWIANYMGQCASLVRQFLVQCYGYPDRPYGDGGDFGSIPKGKRLKTPKDWCIIVYPKQAGLPYGHVAIFYKGKMISQNPNKVAIIPLWKGNKFYVQPHVFKKPTAPAPTKPKPKVSRAYIKKGYKVWARWSAKKNGKKYLLKTYPMKTGLKVLGYINADGYRWIKYATASGKVAYTAYYKLSKPNEKYYTIKQESK